MDFAVLKRFSCYLRDELPLGSAHVDVTDYRNRAVVDYEWSDRRDTFVSSVKVLAGQVSTWLAKIKA